MLNIHHYLISYTLIDKSRKISFFCDLNKISINFRKKFKEVKFINIKFLSKTLSKIKNKKLIIDKNTCSLFFENMILKK